MCCSGYNADISYCPICGNNKNYDNKFYDIFECSCGWKGERRELLTKIQKKNKDRKNKLIKIKKL